MTKSKNNVKKKSTKKNINKKIDSIESSALNELLKVLRILLAVIIFLATAYLLTVFIVGNTSDNDETLETEIQYEEILAGSSFSKKDDEYLVVYYDFSDEELAELTSKVGSYLYNGQYKLYKVDMSNGFNKVFVTEGESNKNPKSVEELTIKGPTLIKFVDGKVVDYIEGVENINSYLE